MIIQGVISKFQKTLDKGYRIQFDTNEGKYGHELDELFQEPIIGYFSKGEKQNDEIEEKLKEIDFKIETPKGKKTQSQILHNVLFRYWEQLGKPTEEFNTYYVQTMSSIINHFKDKLN